MKVHEEMKTVGEQLDSKLAQEVEVLKIDLMTAQQNLETSNFNFNKSSEELKKLQKLYQNIKQDKEELAKKFNCVNEEMNLKKSEAQNINENLIKQISLLENEIKLTKNELENSRINEKQLTLRCNDESIRLKEITNQLIEKEKQLKNIGEEKQNLELRIEKTDQEFKKLNQQKLSIENNFQIIESENQNLKKNVKEIDQKLLDCEHQNCLLNEQLANSSKVIENNQKQFQKDITSKNELIESLNKKLVDYELIMNENNNLSSELKKFELKLKEQSENFNSELNDKSLLIDSQLENITDLNEKLKQSQHQIQTNQSIIDSLKEENVRLEELLQKSELKLIEVNKNYSEKCVQFEQIDDQNKSFAQLLKNKDLHLNNVGIELKNVGKELENCKQLNGTLEALLKETQTVVQNQKQQIESTRNELKKSKQINEDLSLEMKQKFEENEQKVAQNVSTIKSLNEEIMKLRAGFEKEKAKQENQQTLNDQLLGLFSS
jgi:chromosome segregation ATPase